jgi:hypothetical protein
VRNGNPHIVTVGDAQARKETPREFWGAADYAAAAAEDRARAMMNHPPRDFAPLPGPAISLSVNPLAPAPTSSGDRRRLGLPPRPGMDGLLGRLGIRPRMSRHVSQRERKEQG